MRIVFIGSVEFSQNALETLIEIGGKVVGVCTLKESSFNADHCDLSPLCRTHGIPVTYTPNIHDPEVLAWIEGKRPDIIFCFGWSRLLREDLLRIPPMGVVGFHPAALPQNRGRHPIIWALVLGLEKTASSFFFMTPGADDGAILSQEPIPISNEDDARSLYNKVTETARGQIKTFVPALESGSYTRTPQDHSRTNAWRKRQTEDGRIDWRMSSRSIYNLVRGLTKPYVGAHFVYHHVEYKVWRVSVKNDVPVNLEPGKVLRVGEEGVHVRCGEGGVLLSDVTPHLRVKVGDYL